MLFANQLNLQLSGRVLFKNLSFSLLEGERVAFVGHNGAGKSTLLKVLSGAMEADGGKVECRQGTRIGVLMQEPHLNPEHTVRQAVEEGIAPLLADIREHALLCEKVALGGEEKAFHQRLESLNHRIEFAGGFDVEHRIEGVLTRLGVKARHELVKSLSGGERRRVDLARLLLSSPDLLLLDEPTNHLDVNAIAFLVEYLKASPRPLLFISHDRHFIDAVATKIIELHQGELYTHPVPYAQYLENKFSRMEIAERTVHRHERIMAREIAWLRAGAKARTTKQKARIGRAEQLIEEVGAGIEANRQRLMRVQQAKAGRLAKTIVELQHISYAIADRTLIEDFSLITVEGERFGIVGPNGAGKTTLLRLMMGELEPLSGKVIKGLHTVFARFDQNRESLSPQATLKEILADQGDTVFVGEEKVHVASYLERFLFDSGDMYRQVSTLSGGEQNRLLLARLFKTPANVLILDEPTNDLDLTSLGVLEEVLESHKGAAFIVSHDRAFLDRVCTGIIAFEGVGKIVVYQGNYTTYERLKAEQDFPKSIQQVLQTEVMPKVVEKKRKRSYNEEREFALMESKIQALEEERDHLRDQLEDGSLFITDPQGAHKISQRLSQIESEIESLFARWEELAAIGS